MNVLAHRALWFFWIAWQWKPAISRDVKPLGIFFSCCRNQASSSRALGLYWLVLFFFIYPYYFFFQSICKNVNFGFFLGVAVEQWRTQVLTVMYSVRGSEKWRLYNSTTIVRLFDCKFQFQPSGFTVLIRSSVLYVSYLPKPMIQLRSTSRLFQTSSRRIKLLSSTDI